MDSSSVCRNNEDCKKIEQEAGNFEATDQSSSEFECKVSQNDENCDKDNLKNEPILDSNDENKKLQDSSVLSDMNEAGFDHGSKNNTQDLNKLTEPIQVNTSNSTNSKNIDCYDNVDQTLFVDNSCLTDKTNICSEAKHENLVDVEKDDTSISIEVHNNSNKTKMDQNETLKTGDMNENTDISNIKLLTNFKEMVLAIDETMIDNKSKSSICEKNIGELELFKIEQNLNDRDYLLYEHIFINSDESSNITQKSSSVDKESKLCHITEEMFLDPEIQPNKSHIFESKDEMSSMDKNNLPPDEKILTKNLLDKTSVINESVSDKCSSVTISSTNLESSLDGKIDLETIEKSPNDVNTDHHNLIVSSTGEKLDICNINQTLATSEKSDSNQETKVVIEKLQNMNWLKNTKSESKVNPHSNLELKNIPQKKHNESYFEEKPSPEIKVTNTVWTTNSAKQLFPNPQATVIDMKKEEEELSLALAESICTAQQESEKREISTKNLSMKIVDDDDKDNQWGKIHPNLPEDMTASDANNNQSEEAGSFDKFGRIDGCTEKHVFLGKGARKKEEELFKKYSENKLLSDPGTFVPSTKTENIIHESNSNSLKEIGKQSDLNKNNEKVENENKNQIKTTVQKSKTQERPIHGRAGRDTNWNEFQNKNQQKPQIKQEFSKSTYQPQNYSKQSQDYFSRDQDKNSNCNQTCSRKDSEKDSRQQGCSYKMQENMNKNSHYQMRTNNQDNMNRNLISSYRNQNSINKNQNYDIRTQDNTRNLEFPNKNPNYNSRNPNDNNQDFSNTNRNYNYKNQDKHEEFSSNRNYNLRNADYKNQQFSNVNQNYNSRSQDNKNQDFSTGNQNYYDRKKDTPYRNQDFENKNTSNFNRGHKGTNENQSFQKKKTVSFRLNETQDNWNDNKESQNRNSNLQKESSNHNYVPSIISNNQEQKNQNPCSSNQNQLKIYSHDSASTVNYPKEQSFSTDLVSNKTATKPHESNNPTNPLEQSIDLQNSVTKCKMQEYNFANATGAASTSKTELDKQEIAKPDTNKNMSLGNDKVRNSDTVLKPNIVMAFEGNQNVQRVLGLNPSIHKPQSTEQQNSNKLSANQSNSTTSNFNDSLSRFADFPLTSNKHDLLTFDPNEDQTAPVYGKYQARIQTGSALNAQGIMPAAQIQQIQNIEMQLIQNVLKKSELVDISKKELASAEANLFVAEGQLKEFQLRYSNPLGRMAYLNSPSNNNDEMLQNQNQLQSLPVFQQAKHPVNYSLPASNFQRSNSTNVFMVAPEYATSTQVAKNFPNETFFFNRAQEQQNFQAHRMFVQTSSSNNPYIPIDHNNEMYSISGERTSQNNDSTILESQPITGSQFHN